MDNFLRCLFKKDCTPNHRKWQRSKGGIFALRRLPMMLELLRVNECLLKKQKGKPFKDLPMVGATGFEPTASWTRTKRDTKLRHAPIS